MRLLILRHGEAEDTVPDFDRSLTVAGCEAVARTCRGLIERDMRPTVLASSPLVRAQETARIVMGESGTAGPIHTLEALESGADCGSAARAIGELMTGEDTLLAVTHQPFASRFVEYLTGEDTPMKTAMVACVEGDVISAGCCELRWTLKG